jgi:uncharacterized protein (DUF1697 family)
MTSVFFEMNPWILRILAVAAAVLAGVGCLPPGFCASGLASGADDCAPVINTHRNGARVRQTWSRRMRSRVALVVLLRGVNVGGHKTFRPSALATQLKHLDAVNIGAAGTFVIRRPVSRGQLRAEFSRRLPFDCQIAICDSREVTRLIARDFFSNQAARPDIVRFVSVLCRPPRSSPASPLKFPQSGKWLVRILARENRFLVGEYRRHMKAIGYLGKLDDVFGAPVTTRNWNTIMAIARVLDRATE